MDKHMEVVINRHGLAAAPVTPQLFGNAGKEHMEKYGEIECVPVVPENIHTHPKEGWLLEIPF